MNSAGSPPTAASTPRSDVTDTSNLPFIDSDGTLRHSVLDKDTAREDYRHEIDERLQRAGPIFQNSEGRGVEFNDLDFGRQVGILNYHCYPQDSREERERYEKCVQDEKRETARKRREARNEVRRARREIRARHRGGKVVVWDDLQEEEEPEDVDVDVDVEMVDSPMATNDDEDVVVGNIIPPQPPASQGGSHLRPSLNERLEWTDESRTMVRLRRPRVDNWVHSSKTRSAERVQEVEDMGTSVVQPYGRRCGQALMNAAWARPGVR